MKSIKNTLTAMAMAAVLTVGATSANAGLLLSDSAVSGNNQQCAVKSSKGVIIAGIAGVIIAGFPQAAGLLLSDAPTKGCTTTQTDGLLVSD